MARVVIAGASAQGAHSALYWGDFKGPGPRSAWFAGAEGWGQKWPNVTTSHGTPPWHILKQKARVPRQTDVVRDAAGDKW